MHSRTGFQWAFWPFTVFMHLCSHLSLTAKDTGYWQFLQPNPAFIQLLTNTFLYFFSSTPSPTSLQQFILLFVNILSLSSHLILIFSSEPYPASHYQIILPITSALFCLSLETYSASFLVLCPSSHQQLDFLTSNNKSLESVALCYSQSLLLAV